MSASDNIKGALVAAFPGTTDKDWKRRSKSKEGDRVRRDFEHLFHGIVATFEEPDGTVLVSSGLVATEETLVEKITETGKQIVREITAKVSTAPVDLGPITVGDKIQVRKGALVFSLTSYDDTEAEEVSVSERVITTTVANIVHKPKNWIVFLPLDQQSLIEKQMMLASGNNRGGITHLLHWIKNESRDDRFGFAVADKKLSTHAGLAKALMTAQGVYRSLYGDDPRFVAWGKGNARKAAFIGDVIKTAGAEAVEAAKAARKVPEKTEKINKRRLMVEGSKWRFTHDTTISMWVSNPAIDPLEAKRRAIQKLGERNHVQHRSGNTIVISMGQMTGRDNTPEELTQLAALQAEIALLPKQVFTAIYTIPAGTVIEVVGKVSAEDSWGSRGREKTNGLKVPYKVISGSVDRVQATVKLPYSYGGPSLPYKEIDAAVEALEIPETVVYVLRDTATGEFFGGWEVEKAGRYGNRQTDKPKMSKTFSGAKKYKTSSAVKASIRDFTGYNSGINDEGEYTPEYLSGGSKKIDLPETWEMVAIDKTTNTEKKTVDVQDWFKGLMRLRILTQKHCSAVRAAYKKAEEASFEGMDAILLFQNRESGSYQYANMKEAAHYDNAMSFEEEQDGGKAILDAIKKAADNMGGKKIRVKTGAAVAYACSLEDGIMAKMMFNYPNVITRLLDAQTLEDVVDKQEANT